MRQPIHQQIILPMVGIMLVTLAGVSLVDAWLAGRQTQARILQQVKMIAETLAESSFPLTDRVLQQMHGLSGASFVVATADGRVQASNYSRVGAAQALAELARSPAVVTRAATDLTLSHRVTVNGSLALHAVLDLKRPHVQRERGLLHVIYPVARAQRAWRAAVLPPVGVAIASLIVVILVSHRVARRFTRPIFLLRDQVTQIAAGRRDPVTVPGRNDELRDLALDINHMVEMLSHYEQQVRRDEQLRTLDRLGGAMAHQIRNALTGCRMALELHRDDCPAREDEALSVALRQLDLLDGSLRRFLAGGQLPQRSEPVDLVELVRQTLQLVRPQAQHRSVELRWQQPLSAVIIEGDGQRLREVLVNLLLNAIEAAADTPSRSGSGIAAHVEVRLDRPDEQRVRIVVLDTGSGPPLSVQQRMFEPLVTTKPEGLGLGLAMVQEIVASCGGQITWWRDEEMTCFAAELPLRQQENVDVEVAGRR